ncbi:MAG: HD domain-containing protein [Gemmatimonadetes bacterium]|nr:HD domain-containing protein [Gemmatimonadota bacterium]
MTDAPTPHSEVSRSFLQALHEALRTLRAHGTDTAKGRRALNRLRAACDPLLDSERRLQIRIVRQSLYLNGSALVSDIENFVFYEHVLDTFRRAGIGVVTLTGLPTRRDLETFLGLVVRLSNLEDDPNKTTKLRQALTAQSVRGIAIDPPIAGGAELPGEEERKTAAKRTYEESVAISKELFNGTRMGRSANVKQVKHAVQNIVDGVLNSEASLGGLSTLKDYDDYAFTHAVNVCIFCVAIGRRLGLTKAQLYDLGHAGLVHDLGMSRIPHEILTKGSKLTDQERARMEAHTWLGSLSIFELRDFGEIPFQSMLVAYEHHLKSDGTGYPKCLRAREPSVFSKIIAVAAAFDAATNERAYSRARPADEVLRELWERESLGYDPVIVKALINLLGIYPVGTCIILDTYELAIVHSANSDSSFVHRPIVRLLCDTDGMWLQPAPLVDLADTDDGGRYHRSIIKVTSPERYNIQVSDYFV